VKSGTHILARAASLSASVRSCTPEEEEYVWGPSKYKKNTLNTTGIIDIIDIIGGHCFATYYYCVIRLSNILTLGSPGVRACSDPLRGNEPLSAQCLKNGRAQRAAETS